MTQDKAIKKKMTILSLLLLCSMESHLTIITNTADESSAYTIVDC